MFASLRGRIGFRSLFLLTRMSLQYESKGKKTKFSVILSCYGDSMLILMLRMDIIMWHVDLLLGNDRDYSSGY
jgi:hypothetical protein